VWVAASLTVVVAIAGPLTALVTGTSSRYFSSALLASELRGEGACGVLEAAEPRTIVDEPWVATDEVVATGGPTLLLLVSCLEPPRPQDGRWPAPDLILVAEHGYDADLDQGSAVACLANRELAGWSGIRFCFYPPEDVVD